MLEERIQLDQEWKTESEYWNESNVCNKYIFYKPSNIKIPFVNVEFDGLKFPIYSSYQNIALN